jgi:ketosteroid isomerase-like protein
MDETLRHGIAVQVEGRMASFATAQRTRDAEGLLAHFRDVPEFHLYNDGQRIGYATMAAGVRAAFPTLRAIEGGFEGLEVLVLAPDAALATAAFREAVTDAAGETRRMRGAASWLWRHAGGEWRIVYGHVDHYPDA